MGQVIINPFSKQANLGKKVNSFVYIFTARKWKWQSRDLGPGPVAPESTLLSTIIYDSCWPRKWMTRKDNKVPNRFMCTQKNLIFDKGSISNKWGKEYLS